MINAPKTCGKIYMCGRIRGCIWKMFRIKAISGVHNNYYHSTVNIMSQRKYISEFGLNMVNGYRFLLQQEQLIEVDKTGIEPHIYIVTRRPRITLDPSSVKFTNEIVTGTFKKQIKDELISIPFVTKNNLSCSNPSLKCEYPYTDYEIVDDNNEIISNGKCALLLASISSKYWEHLDLEVLYAGQSYGKDGKRTASERLKSHSTLQGIYAEAIKNSPDQDIWLILSTFEPLLLTTFDGSSKNHVKTMEEDSVHIDNVIRTQITEQQQINFTEAALIRYFQPTYNIIYKDSFPNPAHSTYSECYDIDLNMVSVEIQSEDLGLRLWSGSVEPKWAHFCTFPLHSKEDRKYMFEFDGVNYL